MVAFFPELGSKDAVDEAVDGGIDVYEKIGNVNEVHVHLECHALHEIIHEGQNITDQKYGHDHE